MARQAPDRGARRLDAAGSISCNSLYENVQTSQWLGADLGTEIGSREERFDITTAYSLCAAECHSSESGLGSGGFSGFGLFEACSTSCRIRDLEFATVLAGDRLAWSAPASI
jgi:hypothetical protein